MNHTNTGGPAFPLKEPMSNDFQGMTLRDYFAAKAMVAMYQSHYEYEFTGTPRMPEFVTLMEELAADAYGIADAMLKAREQ